MSSPLKYVFLIIVLAFAVLVPAYALAPREILVVYNANPDTPDDQPVFDAQSMAIAEYYANARNIPTGNLLGLSQARYAESITDSIYRGTIAAPISAFLLRPEHSHIKCIVLCYGIPSEIAYWNASTGGYSRCAVDSALTLLGNDGYLATWQPGHSYSSPYCGKKIDFGAFRDSAENVVSNSPGYRLNYLVCRLDGLDKRPSVGYIPNEPDAVLGLLQAVRVVHRFFYSMVGFMRTEHSKEMRK